MRNDEASVSIVPPQKNWRLQVCRRIQTNGKVYNVGCAIEPEALGRNFRALMDNRSVRWVPPDTVITATPQQLPEPTREPPRPVVEIITVENDAVASWKKTYAAMIKKCGNNPALARDILMGDRTAAALYQDAMRVAYSNAKRRYGASVSVSADQLGLL
jgi:hypothetical protein